MQKIITHLQNPCPWCGKNGVVVTAKKLAILRACQNRCGYRAWIPKKILTFAEKVQFYDKRRHSYLTKIKSLSISKNHL